ncbi:hypothetical protein RND81_04G198000 [Saponaria officinalis]|uniref:EF-hand domain-containing protein n=1 Tax=Saponaria officinalis TaxID=3572 RepID=A0AAW1LNN5_SAPOF
MSDGGLQVLDGAPLTAACHPPHFSAANAVDDVLAIVETRVSEVLHGVSLPASVKLSALKRVDVESRDRQQQLDREQAEVLFRDYVSAIADELKDDPLVVSVLDGNTIRLFLEDEDDFAMLAENLFTDLDIEDEGKLSKNEIRGALVHMGVDMGVPPLTEFPVINEILKKHGAEGEEKLGQAQFAQLLQPILQDIADSLALKRITIIQNVKITNGSKLSKLLADEKQIDDIVEKIYSQNGNVQNMRDCIETIRTYLEKNGKELGLPPLEGNETVILLHHAIFSEIDIEKKDVTLEKSELRDLVTKILQKFVLQLQANPVFHDADN